VEGKRITAQVASNLRSMAADYWPWWLVISACVTLRFAMLTSPNQQALGLAVLLLGTLIFVQFLLDLIWAALATTGRDSWKNITTKTYTEGFRQAATTFIGVPGVVLGLLAAFSKPPFSLALKVAASSLTFSLVASIIFLSITSLQIPVAKGALRFLNYMGQRYFLEPCIWSVLYYFYADCRELNRVAPHPSSGEIERTLRLIEPPS
jgi:hypothetical protein